MCTPTARTSGDTNFMAFALLQANARQKQRTRRFILAHSFRGLGPWLLSSMHSGRTSQQWEHVGRDIPPYRGQTEEREERVYSLLRHTLSDLLSPGRSHLLNFSQLPKTALPNGTKNSLLESGGGNLHSNHNVKRMSSTQPISGTSL